MVMSFRTRTDSEFIIRPPALRDDDVLLKRRIHGLSRCVLIPQTLIQPHNYILKPYDHVTLKLNR